MAERKTGTPLTRMMYRILLVLGSLVGSPDVRRYKNIKRM